MLYVTTRNHNNIHTVRHPLTKDRGPDGGLYIPFRNPDFPENLIHGLKDKSFGQCIADILNLYFGTKLSGWDVDFAVGRHPFRLVPMSHKILIAELWNNPGGDFFWLTHKLRNLVMPEADPNSAVSEWVSLVIRMAVIFGIYSELESLELAGRNKTMDISVCSGDFSAPMALYHARQIGLPVGRIVFGCNENSGAWDLIHHGELHTGASVVTTDTPYCDHSVPPGLERLIYDCFGLQEAVRFGQAVKKGLLYTVTEEMRQCLSDGLFGAVISKRRTDSVIRNIFRTNSYQLSGYTALAYGALQDYRSTNNEAGPALILAENGPAVNQTAR